MISRKPFTLLGSAAVPLAALAVAGCGGGGGNASAAPAQPKTASNAKIAVRHVPTVRVATTRLGKILVDSRGRTLYLFTKDAGTKSACAGMCATAWPPLRASGKPTAGSGAKASLVRTTAGSQVTYNGHPLYGFIKDTKSGETNGEGVTAFGGHWFAVSPAGKQVSTHPAKSRSNSSPAPAPAPAAPQPAPKSAPAPKQPSPANSGIPQNNGGDGDADNNGGPSDGDGGI
jgi:predicted lipoprotein with Yx(FWY)xxD motif